VFVQVELAFACEGPFEVGFEEFAFVLVEVVSGIGFDFVTAVSALVLFVVDSRFEFGFRARVEEFGIVEVQLRCMVEVVRLVEQRVVLVLRIRCCMERECIELWFDIGCFGCCSRGDYLSGDSCKFLSLDRR